MQYPWSHLIAHKNFLWQELQTQVSAAALLSPKVSKAGFYICPANYDPNLIQEQEGVQYSGEKLQLLSENLDSLIAEYIDLFERIKKEKKQFKITSVSAQVLEKVNEFIRSRKAPRNYNAKQYLSILNLNLQLITTELNKDLLPSNESLSIELLYAFMIAHYGREILLKCPQLSVLLVTTPLIFGLDEIKNKDFKTQQPKQRKLKQLLKTINKKQNIPYFKRIGKKDFTDVFGLREYLQQKLDKVKDDVDYSKKSRNRLLKLIYNINKHTQLKQDKFEVRQDIYNTHLFSEQDYRFQPNWECIFYQGLKQSLNRIPTSIHVFNNATLRNPKLHLVYPFLLQKSDSVKKFVQNEYQSCQSQIKKVALLIVKARKLGYFTSDWQNKLARVWSDCRNTILQQIKDIKDQKKQIQNDSKKISDKDQSETDFILQVPPALQYSLALDLVPDSHPFSFAFGLRRGYCIDLQTSIKWFLNDCNKPEKAYFYSILSHPEISDKFDFLIEIPPQIRKFRPKKQMEDKFVTKLNDWLVLNGNNKELETVKIVRQFVHKKYKSLPQHLRQKISKKQIQKVSILSLFDAIFDIYHPEEVYLEEVPLRKPFRYEPIQTGSAYKEVIKDINDYWGPPNYGGSDLYNGFNRQAFY